jgi:hypothetical protein
MEMKTTMKQKIMYLILFLCFLTLALPGEKAIASIRKDAGILASKGQKKKVFKISSKKQLVKSLDEHLIKGAKEIRFQIDKKVISNVDSFDKVFWGKKNRSFIASELLSNIKQYSYEDDYNQKSFFVKIKLTYKIPNKELKKVISNIKKVDKQPVIDSREEVKKVFLDKLYTLDKKFILKVSKPIYKELKNDFKTSLEDEPKYNDLAEKVWITQSSRIYPKFGVFEFDLDTKLTKQQADDILAKVTPIIQSRDELFKEIVKRTENAEEEFSLNVASSVINFDDEKEKEDMWDSLYALPEFNDISHHFDNAYYRWISYKGYVKWTKFQKYEITKEDIEYLKKSITKWVADNIRPEMTDEEKVRAINDFMVREYRYTYGDRGELSGDEKGKEKLGKYSVYSSFALLFGGGGVCNSKANMFYRLAKEAGLEVLYISGTGNGGNHAWNMVKVDGTWYHLDNTWNRGHYEDTSEYEYFNNRDYYLKGDESMRKNHSWDASKYPSAPMDYQGDVPIAYNEEDIIKNAA